MTGDVDIVIGAETKTKYFEFIEQLKRLGFYQSVDNNDPVFRFRFDHEGGNLLVDVMSPADIVLGFTNRWYHDGMKTATTHELPNGKKIRLFTLPYLLASKIVAFKGRGSKDPYLSKDLEDIVSLIDGADDLPEELGSAEKSVKDFIIKNLKEMISDTGLRQAIEGHAPRGANIFSKFELIVGKH